jgi:hypothetical protein
LAAGLGVLVGWVMRWDILGAIVLFAFQSFDNSSIDEFSVKRGVEVRI